MKKGFIFTMDAMIALSVMIIVILTIAFVRFETILPEKRYEKLNFMAEDTMNLLEYLEVEEIKDTPTVKELIEKGELERRDLKKSVLDLIASFWYKGNHSIAENISRDVLQGVISDVCLNLTVGNETIYSSCSFSSDKVAVSTRIESGYEPGKPGYGYVAAATLTDIRGKRDSSFAYFGGYVGEGNITRILNLPPFDEILEAYMEMNVNSNFSLYINGNHSGFFTNGTAGGGNMTADKWVVCNETYYPEYCLNFTEGNNTLEFNFTANDSYIGGGYFKVTYNTNQLAPPKDPKKDRYWFPGIKGFINLYSSFYVPGRLNNMTMRLHYLNNLIYNDYGVPVYVTIADKEVFRSDEIGEQDVTLSYDDIWQTFGVEPIILENYISNKTVPITFGTDSFYLTGKGIADAVLITDVSGSMNECDVDSASCLHFDCRPWIPGCQNRRLEVAKDVDIDFIENILKIDGNRAGLVAYSAEPGIRSKHDLTEDKDSLISQINNYNSNGCTCISCGINEAIDILSDPRINKEFIDDKRIWLYNTSYPNDEPPNDGEGDSWNEIGYNDTDWSSGKAILGFEDTPYNPNVNTDIGNNFVLISDDNYNPSSYFLVDTSIAGGSLSDTYTVDSTTFDLLQEGSVLIGEEYTQTKTCSCTSNGCYCDVVFNNFLSIGCTADSATIKIDVRGDLNSDSEYITVYTDGANRGNCCTGDCGQCRSTYSSCASYDVTSYVADNSLTIRCDASSGVNYCSPRLSCQVNLTLKENCPKSKGEVWFNSSTISYTSLPGSIRSRIKFLSTELGNYQLFIYNFDSNNWESTDCDGGLVEVDSWKDYWCNRTWNIDDYISNDNKIKVALNGSSDNQATMKIDFVQYYVTIGEGNYYFRKHFNIDDVSAINNASLYVLSDDRAEVYLNGYLIDNDLIDHNAMYWNRPAIITEPILIDLSYFVEGDNVVAVKLYNDDIESAKFDLKILANINETRKKAMLVMSDGEANTKIPGDNGCEYQYSDDAKIEAINKACEARDNNISVYAVAFGNSADRLTLKKIACWNCSANDWLPGESEDDCSKFYESNNADELEVIYRTIAEEILELGYAAQKMNITGDIVLENILYSDSYIEYNFTPLVIVDPDKHGKVSITREGQRLREFTGDDFITDPVTKTKEGWYNIPEGVTVVDSKMTSYSSEFWTDRLLINSSVTGYWTTVYNLTDYSNDYRYLGDPFIIQIPANYIGAGKNSLRIGTGYSNFSGIIGIGGSPDDRMIYMMRVKGKVGYNETFRNLEDAIEDAKIRLNETIKIYDIYVDDEDIDVDYKSFAGIRSIWGPSLLKIIMWENTTI